MKLLDEKNIIVTGGSRGIGKGIVDKFSEQGANIAFTCIKMSQESLNLVKDLEKSGVIVKAYESDASDFDSAL